MNRHELVISNLRVAVGGREILSGIDLEVRSGEVHAVMGPNGSGKSTLSHVLMGKPGYEVLGGSVTLDGVDILSLPTWRRARLGLFLAPQYTTEVPGVKLEDLLVEALAARFGGDGQSGSGGGGVEDQGSTGHFGATSHVDLASVRRFAGIEAARVRFQSSLLDRPVNAELSGGERKRSETLQLGMLRPPIAILDELDSGLDVDGLRDVAQRVRAAVSEWGLGALVITHYRRLLAELVPDVVHVLVKGRIVDSGGPELAEELERTGYASVVG